MHIDPEAVYLHFEPEAKFIRQETRWVPVEPAKTFKDKDEYKAIGKKLIPCPVCGGQGRYLRLYHGEDLNINRYRYQPCPCKPAQMFWSKMAAVPVHFEDYRLENLKPRVNMPDHSKAIATFQQYPQSSYILLGPPATFKTTFSTALYAHCLRQIAAIGTSDLVAMDAAAQGVWNVSMSRLIEQNYLYATNRKQVSPSGKEVDAPEPEVTAQKIERVSAKGIKPHLFLTEVDKFQMNDFRHDVVFKIFDAIFACNGQFVMDANMNQKSFFAFLDDNVEGLISRRIRKGARLIDFYDGN